MAATAPMILTPHDPDMEQRVARLETDVGEIKATLGRLEPMLVRMASEFTEFRKEMGEFRTDMARTREDMARLDGRVSQLPTMWQLLTGVVGIIGFVFLLLRVGLPH